MEKKVYEEREIIQALFFDEVSLREYAKLNKTNPMKVGRDRDRILKKLKKILK